MKTITSKELYNDPKYQTMYVASIYKTCAKGTKFRIIGDNDPWYISGVLEDDKNCVIVYRSWNRYKKSWIYKVDKVGSFYYMLALLEELVEDDKGNIKIIDRKQ